MFSIKIRPLNGCTRFAQLGLGRAGLTQRCAWAKSLNPRYSSQLNKPSTNPADLLPQQRLRRPVSPHLSIYRPQITWVVSIATRITGVALSGGLYLYATAYFLSPVTGWSIGPESLVAAFSSLSPSTQFAVKFGLALPFVFHSFNGIRHLVWDSGRMLTNQHVAWSGWAVVGSSVVAALLLGLWKPKPSDGA